jgi:PAS domain S-box-containing protein
LSQTRWLGLDEAFAVSPAGGLSRALFEQSPFSTVIYDAGGRPLAVNEAFKAMWGVGLESVPEGYSVLSDEELAKQGVLQEIERAFAGETVITPPVRYDISRVSTSRLGRALWTQGYFFPVRDSDGKVTHVILKHIDLTIQMAIEEQLRASEERLRLATHSAGIGTWDFDPMTGTLLWDDRCKVALGLSPDAESNDEVFHRILHPADVDRVDAAVAHALSPETGGSYDMEYRTIGDDGKVRWVHAVGRVMFDVVNGQRRAVRFIGTVADISDRVSLLDAERTARAEAEFARQRAEEANRAKSEFLAKMSHELRTPLNAIGGHAELIELGVHGTVTPEQLSALERIRKNERHLLALINDILDFSKLEAGAVRLEIQDVAVARIIESLDGLIGPLFSSKGVKYTVGKCDESLHASGDAERITQVLINLLSNALKATPQGGEVSVDCDCDDSSVFIHVRDTGHGIPADRLEAVFSPFTQLGRTLSSPDTGVGLGLAISRELTRAMGGDVTVVSSVGAGSTFTMTLPRTT